MKNHCGIIVFLFVSLLFVCSAWAGGFDNRTNWSAEYVRTWNRNATTDSADGVLYNPAGMTKMDNGLYGNLSVQYVDKYTTNTIDGDELSSREPSYIPGIFALYKKDRWALMAAFSNFGGGGEVNFKDGNWTTQGFIAKNNELIPEPARYTITDQQIEAESMYLGYTFGGAFKINDLISSSVGIRYIQADRKANASIAASSAALPDIDAIIDYKQEADGWGFILGLNLSLTDAVNIGLRYESEVELDFKTSIAQGDYYLNQMGINDGEYARRNLPAIAAVGVSWRMTPKIRVEPNFTYYFSDNADWSGFSDIDENIDNGYDIGTAFMYTINNKWEASIGILYTDLGAEPQYMTPESPELEAFTIGGGVGYSPTEKWTLNAGIGNSFYNKDSFTSYGQEVIYEKNNFILAIGMQYKF